VTTPRQSQGTPPFDAVAQDVIAQARGERPRYAQPPQIEPPLTEAEKAEAEKAAKAALVCKFCLGFHALPNSPGCPRLASFTLNGDGVVIGGTYFSGTKWARGRVVFLADTKEDGDGA